MAVSSLFTTSFWDRFCQIINQADLNSKDTLQYKGDRSKLLIEKMTFLFPVAVHAMLLHSSSSLIRQQIAPHAIHINPFLWWKI